MNQSNGATREPWEDPPADRFDDDERDELPANRSEGDVFGRDDSPPMPPPQGPWIDREAKCEIEWFTECPPRREWLLRDARADDAGVLPRGKVGLLISEGGIGKTMVIVQLALSVASHEDTPWLGCYTVPDQGRVLLLLGEEDLEEVHRRCYNAGKATGAPVPEPESIVVFPLAGVPCAMIELDDHGKAHDAPFIVWLRAYVKENGPFALVVVDPLSRFAGADAETDNAAATRFVQALESIATDSGATVIVAHHTNKMARGNGAAVTGASARGSSAIFDGVRWACALSAEHLPSSSEDAETDVPSELVTLTVIKSNYSRKGAPVTLRRDQDNGGALVALSQTEREAAERAARAADPSARKRAEKETESARKKEITEAEKSAAKEKREKEAADRRAEIATAAIACVRAADGIGTTELRAAIRARAACGAEAADVAIARIVQEGHVHRTEGKGKVVHHHVGYDAG